MTAEVIGKERLIQILELAGPRLRTALVAALNEAGVDLAQYVKFSKLSGQVLKTRTGTLRRSIHATEANDTAEGGMYVDVGTNVPYGRVHEFGFQGVVSVREHLRKQVMAFGKRMKVPREVMVRAHSMHMNMPARPFLRPSLKEQSASIEVKIKEALRVAFSSMAVVP